MEHKGLAKKRGRPKKGSKSQSFDARKSSVAMLKEALQDENASSPNMPKRAPPLRKKSAVVLPPSSAAKIVEDKVEDGQVSETKASAVLFSTSASKKKKKKKKNSSSLFLFSFCIALRAANLFLETR